MTPETRNLFIEVTGESTPTCKKVLETLLHGMIKLNLGDTTKWPQLGDPAVEPPPVLEVAGKEIAKPSMIEVEPVRVVDKEGKLLVVFPSRVDLIFDDVNVTRDA